MIEWKPIPGFAAYEASSEKLAGSMPRTERPNASRPLDAPQQASGRSMNRQLWPVENRRDFKRGAAK
jgi:hypothetical protein